MDSSAVFPWVFGDKASTASDRLFDEKARGESAWVPGIWPLELGKVLLGAMRKEWIDEAGVAAFVTQLFKFAIELDPDTSSRALDKTLDLAQKHGLSTDGDSYHELAMRPGVALDTLDRQLATAGRAAGVKRRLS